MATATQRVHAGRQIARDGPRVSDSAVISFLLSETNSGDSRWTGDRPVDLVTRREAAIARDDSDVERWLDEGGGPGLPGER